MIDYDDDWVSWRALPLAGTGIPSIYHSLHLIILIKVPDIVSALIFGRQGIAFCPGFGYHIGAMTRKPVKTSLSANETGDYDSAWKDVIEELFEPFLAFYFPHIHQDIDFSKGYTFLSKELRKIAPDGKVGNRYADELVKVYLKNGSTGYICIFIHVEVQGAKDTDFLTRMYVYNYRIFDKFRQEGAEVISLAILTDEDKSYRPDEYRVSRWGFELKLKIPVVKLIDYRLDEVKKQELESSENPMAMVVRAHFKSHEVKKAKPESKFSAKTELIRQCYRRGGSDERRRFMNERDLGRQFCSGTANRTLPSFRGKNFDV